MKPLKYPGSKGSPGVAFLACFGGIFLGAMATPARGESLGWLRGDDALVAKVRDLLMDRGFDPDRPRDTSCFVVVLRDDGQSVHVTATWPDGRVVERIVATPETAATVIESIDRHDLADPLLAPRRPPAKKATSGAPAPVVSATPALPPQAASPTLVFPQFSVGMGGVAAVGIDGSIALGAAASACFPIGRACLGARTRYLDGLRSPRGDGAGADPSHVEIQRSNVDLLATIELPIPWGAFRLVPGAAFGVRVVFASAGAKRDEVEGRSVGGSSELSIDLVRVFGNGLALSLGVEALALLGGVVDGRELGTVWVAGQPRWSMLGNLGVRFYP
jgi:hypothetical protein